MDVITVLPEAVDLKTMPQAQLTFTRALSARRGMVCVSYAKEPKSPSNRPHHLGGGDPPRRTPKATPRVP